MSTNPRWSEQSHHGERMGEAEFERLVESEPDARYEYINGRVYAMAGATPNHNRLGGKLYRILEDHLTSGPCHAFIGEVYVQVNERDKVLPDVTVTCDVSDYRDDNRIIRSPHLIIEVLSPSTERTDRTEKFFAYTRLPSLQEYVLVSQKHREVEVYRKIDGWVQHLYGPGDEVELTSLDITFSIDELYRALL